MEIVLVESTHKNDNQKVEAVRITKENQDQVVSWLGVPKEKLPVGWWALRWIYETERKKSEVRTTIGACCHESFQLTYKRVDAEVI